MKASAAVLRRAPDVMFDRRTGGTRAYTAPERLPVLDQAVIEHALRKMDREKLLELAGYYKLLPMIATGSVLFWAALHKARVQLVNATDAERRDSEEWLRANGFTVRDSPESFRQRQASQSVG